MRKLRLLLVCALIMGASFITENYHSFFGDWKCEGSGEYIVSNSTTHYGSHFQKCDYGELPYHNPTWHWGFRHWVFFAFGMAFTIWSIVEIVEGKKKDSY
jgi:hypothetical protein